MPIADLIDDEVLIETEFRDRDAIKLLPGVRYVEAGRWRAPLSWATCKALRGIFTDRLTVMPALAEWAWTERTGRVDPALELRTALDAACADDLSADGSLKLFPPQKAAVAFLQVAGSGLIGTPMGAGKTAIVIKALTADTTAWPVLVVAPNRVKSVWRDQVALWNTGEPVEVRVLTGGTPARRKQLAGIEDGQRVMVVLNWESARLMSRVAGFGSIRLRRCPQHGGDDPAVTAAKCEAHPKELNAIPWRTVVVDEAHRGKDPQSKQTRAVWALQHGDTVRRTVSCTGTPLAQHLGDLWAIMHGCAEADFPSGKSKFIDRYALTTWNEWGGLEIGGVNPQHQEELFSFLDPRFRHLPKEVLLPFLPPKVYETHEATMSPKQERAYADMAGSMIAQLDEGVVVTTNALAQYTRMLQFAAAYAEVDTEGHVQLRSPSCKVDALVELLEDIDERESVAVAMISRQLLELCEVKLQELRIPYTVVKGGQTEEESDRAVRDFQDRRVRVILLMTQAGGVGITLTTAPHLIRLQRSWSLIDNLQLEDRVHRIGSEQHAQVTIHDVVTVGTLEEGRQAERLAEKGLSLQDVLRDKELLTRLLSGREL